MDRLDLTMEELDARLAEQGRIAILWRIADVLEIRPDLTHAQAWQVLQEIKRDHASGIGVNWSTLDYVASELFGDGPIGRAA